MSFGKDASSGDSHLQRDFDVGGGSAVGADHDVSCSLHKLKILTFDETVTKFRKVQFFFPITMIWIK
jgi:hypothetical protein